jgi:hypothetical protein
MDVLYNEMFSDSVLEFNHEYKKIHRTPEKHASHYTISVWGVANQTLEPFEIL